MFSRFLPWESYCLCLITESKTDLWTKILKLILISSEDFSKLSRKPHSEVPGRAWGPPMKYGMLDIDVPLL